MRLISSLPDDRGPADEPGATGDGTASGDVEPAASDLRGEEMASSRKGLPGRPAALIHEAAKTLRRNDMGGWIKAAPNLYPHQWSWDSAFIAIGLSHMDTRRAARELETLFAHQWKTGKVPHIVFSSDAPAHSYFPGSEHWACAAASPDAPPAPPYTSCLSQPPIHALAALRIWEAAGRGGSEEELAFARAFLKGIYPKLLSWHRYLLTYGDPEKSGLVTIYHPWGSGTDNSPRWDAALAAVEVGDVGPYPRYDLQHVGSPSQRPTNAEYDRYPWLVELIKRARCDEATVYESNPFLVKDVLTSAILVAANEALLEIAGLVEAHEEDLKLISDWIVRGRQGLESCWDAELGLCLDHDLRADRPLRARTVTGFAPLIAGGLSPQRLDALLKTLDSPMFLGHRGLRWPLPPSTSPEDPGFDPCSYWRGPTWPVVNWLIWRSLIRAGEAERAEALRQTALEQLIVRGFGEYFDPFTGELLGSADQSWTAAVGLDWRRTSRPEKRGWHHEASRRPRSFGRGTVVSLEL